MPTSYLDDHAPVAMPDSVTLSTQQVSAETPTAFSWVDGSGHVQSYFGTAYGTTFDVLGNDYDPDPTDTIWIFDFTQPTDAAGHPVGTLSVEKDASNHDVLRFYDAHPDEVNPQVVSFSYRAADQWADASGDTARNANSVSQWATVTLTVSGNSVPGETLTGTNHPQQLEGHAGNDKLIGGNQEDTLIGGAGADTLIGNNGKDLLLGGPGADQLLGGNGDDTLDGGLGDDVLVGGNGADRFVFDYDPTTGMGFGHDTIVDFDPKNDKIVVDHNMWGSFDNVQGDAEQVGADVVLTSNFGGYTITLQHVKLASLNAADFIFT